MSESADIDSQNDLKIEDDTLCNSLTEKQEEVIRDVISRVTDRWSLWALSELTTAKRSVRFSELRRRVEGVSQKSLTATLRQLERDGLVKRTVVAQVPIRVDYEATSLGHELTLKVHPLWMWVAVNLPNVNTARRSFDRRAKKSASRHTDIAAPRSAGSSVDEPSK